MTKIRKRLSKKKEEKGKREINFGQHNVFPRPHPACIPPYPHSAYEEARRNKAYYDECRQNVINGERAEHMRKSLLWLKVASILLCITFCMCLSWSYFKLGGDELIVPTYIMFGLGLISTGCYEWHERKIRKLVNVK